MYNNYSIAKGLFTAHNAAARDVPADVGDGRFDLEMTSVRFSRIHIIIISVVSARKRNKREETGDAHAGASIMGKLNMFIHGTYESGALLVGPARVRSPSVFRGYIYHVHTYIYILYVVKYTVHNVISIHIRYIT